MLQIDIPGLGSLQLKHMICDYNGTLAVDGRLIDGVAERLEVLGCKLAMHVVTGDTFGISYRELDSAAGPYIFPTSTPVQFEPEPLKASIATLLQRAPEAMYLTHYGRVGNPSKLADDLYAQIDAMVDLTRAAGDGDDAHARLVQSLRDYYRGRIRAHGCALDDAGIDAVIAMDVELNAQGLRVWAARAA